MADLVSLGCTLATVAVVTWRYGDGWRDLLVGCQCILAVYLLLSPTVMPWYLIWALPLWALRPGITWPTMTALSLLSYLVYIDGVEHGIWLALEFGLFFAVVLAVSYRRGSLAILKRPAAP